MANVLPVEHLAQVQENVRLRPTWDQPNAAPLEDLSDFIDIMCPNDATIRARFRQGWGLPLRGYLDAADA